MENILIEFVKQLNDWFIPKREMRRETTKVCTWHISRFKEKMAYSEIPSVNAAAVVASAEIATLFSNGIYFSCHVHRRTHILVMYSTMNV